MLFVPSGKCRDFIKGFESCRLEAYQDLGGVWTIGWGHTGPDVTPGLVITQQWADQLFDEDVDAAAAKLRQWIGDGELLLKQNEFDALVSFVFNVKLRPGESCHLLSFVHDGFVASAADEFQKWCHAEVDGQEVEVAGLLRRRLAERRMFLFGD